MNPYGWLLILLLAFLGFVLSTERLVLPYEHKVRFERVTFREPFYLMLVFVPLSFMELGVFSLYRLYTIGAKQAGEKMILPNVKAYFHEIRHALSMLKDMFKGGNGHGL